MKEFLTIITVEDPYEKKFEYRTRGTRLEVAQHRAIRKFRAVEWKGRPLKKLSVLTQLLASINLNED